MRYELSTAATGTPISREDVIDFIRVVDTDDYALITALVDRATRYVERRIQRQLLTATWKLYLDAFPAEILLEKLPVASVTSITYTDLDGDTETLAATEYQTDYSAPDRPGRIKPAYGKTWPNTRSSTYNAVTVTFTAGYGTAADVPATIKQALLLLVQHWYDQRAMISQTQQYTVPTSVDSLLAIEDWGSYA